MLINVMKINYLSFVCFVLCASCTVNTNLLHSTEYTAHKVDKCAAVSTVKCNGLECIYMLKRYTLLQTFLLKLEGNLQYILSCKLLIKVGYDVIMETCRWLFMTYNIGVEIPYDNG